MNVNCEACMERSIEYAHGELPPAEAGAVAEHLGGCGECAMAYCRLAADLATIAVAHAESPSPQVRDKLRAAVAERFAPPWWRRVAMACARPIPVYGAVALAAIPLLAWIALDPLDARVDEARDGGGAARTEPLVRDYDAIRTPTRHDGVL